MANKEVLLRSAKSCIDLGGCGGVEKCEQCPAYELPTGQGHPSGFCSVFATKKAAIDFFTNYIAENEPKPEENPFEDDEETKELEDSVQLANMEQRKAQWLEALYFYQAQRGKANIQWAAMYAQWAAMYADNVMKELDARFKE